MARTSPGHGAIHAGSGTGGRADRQRAIHADASASLPILRLQRTVGNRAVTQLVRSRAGRVAIQRKSKFLSLPTGNKKETPLESLHKALGPFFNTAGVPEVYHFHGMSVQYANKPYQKDYEKATEVTAEIDPASASKADGSNRNNTIIQAYGHLGVMERAIFNRPNLGNLYDGGHLIEHTLMEGQDADVEGNLAPQQNKHFNQGLMRGWESIPEHYRDKNITFHYTVKVEYQEDSYTRTGKDLRDANVLGPLDQVLNQQQLAALDAKQVSFERWIPSTWKAKISRPSNTPFPLLTLNRGAHWNSMKPTQADAEREVFDHSYQSQAGNRLKRTNSGMLGGFVESAFVPQNNPSAVTVGGYPTISAYMYQPEPQDRLDQPEYTNNPGAYGNSNPTPLPVKAPNVSLLTTPVNVAQLGEELYQAVYYQQPSGGGKVKKKRRAKKVTELNKLDGIGKKHSPNYSTIRNVLLRNAKQGGRFVEVLTRYRHKSGSLLTKGDLVKIIQEVVTKGDFIQGEKFKLLDLPYDKNLQ
jgi:hypothetical protein